MARATSDLREGRAAGHQSKSHPVEESKNEKRQKSADYGMKKSLFSKHAQNCATPPKLSHFRYPFAFSHSEMIF